MTTTATSVRANARKTTNGFWWTNLSASDPASAAAFYSDILGWSYDEMPIGENMVHRNARIGDATVAGIDPLMPGSDAPTAWTNYVFVDDVQATWRDALALGATGVMEPMDVMGEGHMAVLLDPQGAAFGIWQPGRHTGADAVNQPGTYTWVELATTDVAAARSFYGELFGWTWSEMDADFGYWLAELGGRSFAGVYPKLPEMGEMPNFWATYFGVADIEATASAVRAAGGTVVMGPSQLGPGRGVAAFDPQGAAFMAIQMDEWPAD
ncbi:MAG: VOC family protein [Thermoleophilia bacterium]|nr:VOC family protein [Thermoleophilia bacterium]